MLTKKLQTIGLAALFLDEGEKSEDTVLKKKKRSFWVRTRLQWREEKAVKTNILKKIFSGRY